MWTLNGAKFINKADIWKQNFNWEFVDRDTSIYIARIKIYDGSHFDYLGSYDFNNVIQDSRFNRFNADQKSWQKGEKDNEGYFKLTHATSQKILTATFPNKLILVDKGRCIFQQVEGIVEHLG